MIFRSSNSLLIALSTLICFAADADAGLLEDYQITNDDFSTLDVKINPPIRLNLFPTSRSISSSAVRAILNAINGFATKKIKEYLVKKHGGTYVLDKVNFEAIIIESISTSRRKLRTFEREEAEVANSLSRELGIEESLNLNIGRGLEEEFGTSIVLGGNITFAISPTLPNDECNAALVEIMQKYWGINYWIQQENHKELERVTMEGISSELLVETLQPTTPITDSPSVIPPKSPSPRPTSTPTNAPSLTAQLSDNPSESPSAFDEVVTPISITSAGGTIEDPGKDRNILLRTALPLGVFALIALGAFYAIKRRRKKLKTSHKAQEDDKSEYTLDRPNEPDIESFTIVTGIESGSGSGPGFGSESGSEFDTDNNFFCSCNDLSPKGSE